MTCDRPLVVPPRRAFPSPHLPDSIPNHHKIMWKACRKRAPITELEGPSSPLPDTSSAPSISSPTPPPRSQTPGHKYSPPQTTRVEEAPTLPPNTSTETQTIQARKRRATICGEAPPLVKLSRSPNETAASSTPSCYICKTLGTSAWRKTIVDGEATTVCNACNCALWRQRRKSLSDERNNAEEAAVDERLTAGNTRPRDEISRIERATTPPDRRSLQRCHAAQGIQLELADEKQLSRPHGVDWSTHSPGTHRFRADRTDTVRGPGEDLAALAKSLGWLSQLLERACKECSAEQIGWLEQHLGHEWKVDEMTIFIHGFLSGIAKNQGARNVFANCFP